MWFIEKGTLEIFTHNKGIIGIVLYSTINYMHISFSLAMVAHNVVKNELDVDMYATILCAAACSHICNTAYE